MGEVAIDSREYLCFVAAHSPSLRITAEPRTQLPTSPLRLPLYYSPLVETNACKRRLGFWQNSRQHTTCRVVSNQWLEWTVGLGGQLSVEALDER